MWHVQSDHQCHCVHHVATRAGTAALALVLRCWWLVVVGLASMAGAQEIPSSRPRFDPKQTIQRVFVVPNVVGQELSQAQEALNKAGFGNESIEIDKTGGRRIVARSAPAVGERFVSFERPVVKLYIRGEAPPSQGTQTAVPSATQTPPVNPRPGTSDGPIAQLPPTRPPVTTYPPSATPTPPPTRVQRMPSLLGMSCAEAQQQLAPLHRRLNRCDAGAATGRAGPGRIHTQLPPVGSALTTDSIVSAVTEPDFVVVPGVVDLPLNEAMARIGQAGLRALYGGGVTRWHVVQSQEPSAGRRAPPQSAVRLELAARYVVPDISGMSCARAQVLVANAGLGALQCRVEAGAGNPRAGVIHSQVPAPRTVLGAVQPVQAVEQPVQVTVPNVVGQPEATAMNLLAQQKLRAVANGAAASAGRYVAAQSPAGGSVVLPGRDVTLTLELSVPPLQGMDCDGARGRAQAHGFNELTCERKLAGPTQALNRVFEQAPLAGTRSATPQPVRVAIALPVTVPSVVGQGLPQALGVLDKARLKGQADGADGERDVVAQKPAAGTAVAPGSVIALNTQRFSRVPAVTGLYLGEAQTRLAQANFTAQPDQQDRAVKRRVDRQTPAAGERLAVGRAVALVTHVEVEVPDVMKQRLPQASATLTQHGLRAKPDHETHAADREVRAQRPAAGARVPEHSDVTLETVRLVKVPNLAGISCTAADARAKAAGLRLERCDVQSLSPLVLGEALIIAQSLPTDRLVDEGAAINAQAPAQWWSVPVQTGTVASFGFWFGLWFRRRVWPGAASPQSPQTSRVPPPPTLPPPAALLTWRIAPDALPQGSLRMALNADDTNGAAGPWPRVRWRVIDTAPVTCLRSSEILQGDDDDHQR